VRHHKMVVPLAEAHDLLALDTTRDGLGLEQPPRPRHRRLSSKVEVVLGIDMGSSSRFWGRFRGQHRCLFSPKTLLCVSCAKDAHERPEYTRPTAARGTGSGHTTNKYKLCLYTFI